MAFYDNTARYSALSGKNQKGNFFCQITFFREIKGVYNHSFLKRQKKIYKKKAKKKRMKLNKNCKKISKNWKADFLDQLKQHDKTISYENSQKLAINKAYFHQIVFP